MIRKIVISLHKRRYLTKSRHLIRRSTFFIVAILAVAVLILNNLFTSKKPEKSIVSCDLKDINKRGRLIALADFNTTDYFIYKGEPMGFNYELLNSFAKHIGTQLQIIPVNNVDKAEKLLESGKADLIAMGLPVNAAGLNNIRFSEPFNETRQVLVQRKVSFRKSVTSDEGDKNSLRLLLGLTGKTIYIQNGFPDAESLVKVASGIGDSVHVVEVPYEPEKLVKYVADGIIDYTVCDENLALLQSTYYSNLDVNTAISAPRKIAWALRKNDSDSLMIELNKWITDYRKTKSYALLYGKYFRSPRSGIVVKQNSYALNNVNTASLKQAGIARISRFDDIIREFSMRIKWDWRLLASLICQESGFRPDVISAAGAYGLMQIMPGTGRKMGIDITSSPENNIKAGIKYLNYLHSIFDPKIPDEKERINFILAAYNAGPGHVIDAMKLAEKNGMDPHKWEGNVAVWLQKKSQPEYYNDTVVKNGYFKGLESVSFVTEILHRYEHYKNIAPDPRAE